MLDETLVARNPVFHTSHPLTTNEFKDSKFADDYVDSIKTISQTLKAGFELAETDDRLDKEQWLRSAAQLMASIHEGVYRTFPLLNAEEYKSAFGPDESDAARDFSFAVGSLHYFLTNTVVDLPHKFKQCARCLKVSSTVTTADDLEAHLMSCNQDADAARLTIINATIKEARDEALRWKDEQTARAQDQVVLAVINSNPPPFSADPRIEAWVARQADTLRNAAEVKATEDAVVQAHETYKVQLAITQAALEEDLRNIQDAHTERLAKAREDAAQQLAQVKAEIRTECEQRKIDLEHDRLFGKATKRRNARPTPLDTTTPRINRSASRSSSRAPSPAASDRSSLASEVVFPKDLITVPHDVDMTAPDSNSLTPRADIPLVPQPSATPDPTGILAMMAQGFKQLTENFTGKLDQLANRLDTIENKCQDDDYDHWNPQWGYDIEHAGANLGYPDENTPEQDAMLAEQRHRALLNDPAEQRAWDEHERLVNEADDARMDEEDNWRDKVVREGITDKDIEEAGGDPAVDRDPTTRQARYAPGLIRLGEPPHPPPNVGPAADAPERGDRRSQPITVQSSQTTNPPAPTAPTAPAATPAPLTYAERAKKAADDWKVVTKKKRPQSIPMTSTLANVPRTNGKAWSIDKLTDNKTTMQMIRDHAETVYGAKLSTRVRKAGLIVAYQQLATNPPAAQPTRQAAPRQSGPPRHTSEWTIRRLPNTGAINFQRPYNGDPLKLVRQMQTALRQLSGKPEPPLTLLAGRWSHREKDTLIIWLGYQ